MKCESHERQTSQAKEKKKNATQKIQSQRKMEEDITLAALDDALAQKHVLVRAKSDELSSLEEHVQDEVAASARANRHISKEELELLMKWKLRRGMFRPGLQKKIEENNEQHVVALSHNAYSVLESERERERVEDKLAREAKRAQTQSDAKNQESNKTELAVPATLSIEKLKEALKYVMDLRGVGIATASKVLSIYEERVPFMSDEAMKLVGFAEMKYTLPQYLEFVERMNKLCDRLNDEWQQSKFQAKVLSFPLNVALLEQALWCVKQAQNNSKRASNAAAPAKRRKSKN
jgi:hypothetical protein